MHARRTLFLFGRPQKIAALFLLAFAVQALFVANVRPLAHSEVDTALRGKALWSRGPSPLSATFPTDGVLAFRMAGVLPALDALSESESTQRLYSTPARWQLRFPFVCFGVWLGGGLWWVARRLFNDYGGYVTLALF